MPNEPTPTAEEMREYVASFDAMPGQEHLDFEVLERMLKAGANAMDELDKLLAAEKLWSQEYNRLMRCFEPCPKCKGRMWWVPVMCQFHCTNDDCDHATDDVAMHVMWREKAEALLRKMLPDKPQLMCPDCANVYGVKSECDTCAGKGYIWSDFETKIAELLGEKLGE